jgi:hypothetical protein
MNSMKNPAFTGSKNGRPRIENQKTMHRPNAFTLSKCECATIKPFNTITEVTERALVSALTWSSGVVRQCPGGAHDEITKI